MIRKISFFFITVLMIGLINPVEHLEAREIGFGFHGGYINSDFMDSGFYVGIQMRYKLSPAFGFEVAFDYRDEKSNEDLELKNVEGKVPGTTLAKSYPLTGTLIFTLFAERMVPLNLMGGIGIYTYSFTFRPEGYSEESETDVQFGYHLGLGTEYAISLGVKGEAAFKYLFMNLEDEYGDIVLSEAQANAWMISLGLTFYM